MVKSPPSSQDPAFSWSNLRHFGKPLLFRIVVKFPHFSDRPPISPVYIHVHMTHKPVRFQPPRKRTCLSCHQTLRHHAALSNHIRRPARREPRQHIFMVRVPPATFQSSSNKHLIMKGMVMVWTHRHQERSLRVEGCRCLRVGTSVLRFSCPGNDVQQARIQKQCAQLQCPSCHLGWRTLVLKCNKNNYD